MTREEAKAILEEVKELDDSIYQYNSKYLEALRMAIKALEAQDIAELLKVRDEINEYGSIMVEYSTNPIWATINDELNGKIGERAIKRLWKKIDNHVDDVVSSVIEQAKEAVIRIINEHIGEEHT